MTESWTWIITNVTKKYVTEDQYTPKKIIYRGDKTIVLWEDGTRTMVKCTKDDTFCEDHGFAMALAKKIFGSRGAYMDYVEKASYQKDEKFVKKDSA